MSTAGNGNIEVIHYALCGSLAYCIAAVGKAKAINYDLYNLAVSGAFTGVDLCT